MGVQIANHPAFVVQKISKDGMPELFSGNPSDLNRPETIEETAEMVADAGGVGIPVQVDHGDEAQVEALFRRIGDEQNGRLDVLVNDIWGGEQLTKWGTPFWEHSLSDGLRMQERAVWTHMITSYYAAPLMVSAKKGLIIEVTDGVDYRYRGNLYYSLAKISAIHLAQAMAEELRPHHVAVLAVTPGFLRSEEMLDYFGVTEANWRDAVKSGLPHAEHFMESETPYFIGRGIAALALTPMYSGKPAKCWGVGTRRMSTGLPTWTAGSLIGATTPRNKVFWTESVSTGLSY